MNLAEFLSSLFCGAARAQVVALKSELVTLEKYIDTCREIYTKSVLEVNRLQSLCNEYLVRAELAEADTVRFYERLLRGAEFPPIETLADLSTKTIVDPWIMTPSQWFGVRTQFIGDDLYYAFPEEEWLKMLAPVQAEVKRVVKRKADSISDCENWSLTMCNFLAVCFLRAGLDKQGAFMMLSSGGHNYCGFMLPDYRIRVYEPLSGKVVGWLGETDGLYVTQLAFFLA